MLESKPNSSDDKQQQEQNSPNLGCTFYLAELCRCMLSSVVAASENHARCGPLLAWRLPARNASVRCAQPADSGQSVESISRRVQGVRRGTAPARPARGLGRAERLRSYSPETGRCTALSYSAFGPNYAPPTHHAASHGLQDGEETRPSVQRHWLHPQPCTLPEATA